MNNLLLITQHSYEMRVFNLWMIWCELNSTDDKELQQLMANTALFNWWINNLKDLEQDFKIWVQLNPNSDRIERKNKWYKSVEPIKHIYAKSLIKKAKENVYQNNLSKN